MPCSQPARIAFCQLMLGGGAALLVGGCNSEWDVSLGADIRSAGGGGGSGGGIVLDDIDAGGARALAGSTGMPAEVISTVPEGFMASSSLPGQEAHGGYKLVGPLQDFQGPDESPCANILRAIGRDFTDQHLDFGGGDRGHGEGFLLSGLGEERKPMFNEARVAGNDILRFGDWYRNVDGVNQPFIVDFWLEPVEGSFIFSSGLFFPLDAVGFPERHYGHDGKLHNFLFTTELHTSFRYNGGEEFLFRGDDDVYVFINKQLAVDMGGIHGPQEGRVRLDDAAAKLGIELGSVYPLDLFQAERNPKGSNFRIETTLDFTDCGEILPGDVVK